MWRRPDVLTLLLAAALFASGCPLTLSRPHSEEAQDSFAEADRHAHHGRVDEAVEAYRRAAAEADRRVDRDEALYRLSRLLRRADRFEEAVEVLDQIWQAEPPSRRTVRALYDASLIRYTELDQREAGLEGLRRVLTEHGSDGSAARAFQYVRADFEGHEDVEGLLAYIDATYPVVREFTVADDLLQAKHELLLARGDRDGARAALELIVENHPYPQGHRWDDSLLALATMDEEDGEHRRAIRRLRTLVNRHETTMTPGSYTLTTFMEAQIRIARIFRDDLEDYARADEEFRTAYDEFPHSTLRDDALVERGEMWLEHGDPERGCGLLRDAVEQFEVGRARRRAEERLATSCDGSGGE